MVNLRDFQRNRKTQKETGLVSACCQLLALRKVPYRRVYTTGIPEPRSASGFKPNPMRGIPDIIACLPPSGRLFGIECKLNGNRLSEAQKLFFDAFQGAGAACRVIHQVIELDEALRELGVRP